MTITKKVVEDTFRKHFASLREMAAAHNATLEELAPPYRPDMTESEARLRAQVANWIREVSSKVALELGDPFEVAIHDAMKTLRAQRVVPIALKEYEKVKEVWREEARREGISLEEYISDYVDEDLMLYIEFDDEDGSLVGWSIDTPQYYRGHRGPVAAVPINDELSYGEIESEIGETLSQSGIFES